MKQWVVAAVALAAVLTLAVARADARGAHVTLTVAKAGSGSGRVTSTPAYVDCGQVCSALVPTLSEAGGAPLTLTASPDPGSVFTGWAGDCSGNARSCTVEPEDATTVTAIFDLPGTQTSFPLAIGKTGNGTVTSSLGGIDCGPTCAASFPPGATVTLTASPADGWTFAGWSGGCSGTDACTVTLDGPKAVSARFEQQVRQTFPLVVGGSGDGTIASRPPGIDCGTTCALSLGSGTTVTLTATPGSGATFSGWGGACSGTSPCTVTMDGPKAVTANFGAGAPELVALGVGKTGNGGITSSPAGIDCGGACNASFANGTRVALTATPATGWTFAGWSGACSGTGSCTLVVESPKAVAATFTEAPTFPLAVSKSGSGTVGSNPAGIDCGPTCSASFRGGTTVTLIAVPEPGAVFSGWTGICAGNGPTCPIVLNEAESTTALFRNHADTVAPVVKALASTGRRGAAARLRYRVSDLSGVTRQTVTVRRGTRAIATLRTALLVVTQSPAVKWRVPRRLERGTLRFCIRATDKVGNTSGASCAPLRIR